MRAGPDQRNRSLRCDYHRDHGHETNHCQSLKFLVEKLIRAGHLRKYIREPTRGVAAAPTADRVVVDIEHALAINFILGGPADSQYKSKNQRRKMLRTAPVRAGVNTLITMHSYLLCVLTVLMCTGSSSIQARQPIYYTSQPLSR